MKNRSAKEVPDDPAEENSSFSEFNKANN